MQCSPSPNFAHRPGRIRRRAQRLGLKARDGAGRAFSGSSSMTIISAWARVENSAIAVPSGITTVAKPIAVMKIEPMARPAL
jgi:hypothetical protein